MHATPLVIVDTDPVHRRYLEEIYAGHGNVLALASIGELLPAWSGKESGKEYGQGAGNAWYLVHDEDDQLDDVLAFLDAHGRYFPVIAFGRDPGAARVANAMRRGVLDYLQTPFDGPQLLAELDRLQAPALTRIAIMRAGMQAQRKLASLSQRQREILDAIGLGLSSKMIARALGISPRTVEIHRSAAMRRLNVSNCFEAVWLVNQAERISLFETPLEQHTELDEAA